MPRVRAVLVAVLLLSTMAALGPTPIGATTTGPTTPRPETPVAPAAPAIALQLVTPASSPVFATGINDGRGRLFIVEKGGRIRIFRNGQLLATPYLDIHTLVTTGSEQGLLGLAFSPSFNTNHKLYVNYTNTSGNTVVAEYRQSSTNPDVVSTSTRRVILTIAQPYANHNGGMLAFRASDGDLYIGMGDGGSGGDPGNRAQSLSSLLGKILRIDVRGSTSTRNYLIPSTNPYVGRTGLDEIWARGTRNPWRFSFDRENGNLWIGDVGQETWEEVDRAISGRGLNFGWRVMEGRHCYNPSSGCSTTGLTLPPVEYDHSNGRCAVTGGYVYRGSAIPGLVGAFLFGDYCSGEIWLTTATSTAVASKTLLLDTTMSVSSFGQDEHGELYVCDLNGAVYKIVPG